MTRNRLALAMASLGIGASSAAGAAPTVALVESLAAADGVEAGTVVAASALGFVVETDGFLVTTYQHLADPATGALRQRIRCTVEIAGRPTVFPARIIGVEPTLDFAVLKIDDAPALEPARLAQQTGLSEGQEIFTMARGVPSEDNLVLGRLLTLNSIECYQESLTQAMFAAEMVRPDAVAVGSPVFGRDGEVVALYTGYEPPHEPGEPDDEDVHLLPVHLISTIYESLKQRQSMASPWTGFSVRSLADEEKARFPVLGGKFTSGILLEHIWPDGPAQAMGLQEGDILLQFAHHPVPSVADFQKWLYLYGVGHQVKMFILRGDQALAYEYAIEERPSWAKPR